MRPQSSGIVNRRSRASDRPWLRAGERAIRGLQRVHRHLRRPPLPSQLTSILPAGVSRLCCSVLGLIMGAILMAGCGASLNSEMATPTQARLSTQLAGAEPGANRFVRTGQLSATANVDRMAYKIGPLDVLDISVFKVPELSTSVQVAETGTINLPLLGEVPAAGKTAEDVERDLAAKLGAKYLKSPQVTVFIKEYNSQRITIEGAVNKPGVYPIKGGTTLLQSIAMARGLASSYESTVLVFRQTAQRRSAAKFDIDAIKDGRSRDPLLRQGDVIVVNSSTTKEAYNHVLRVIPVIGTFIPFLL